MKEEIIIAGFGGQGVLSMGKILAYSGVMQDLEVSWMPSYGPEMRGGTANVTVILSDRPISSPISHNFDTAILLNQQSMDKFEPMIKPGGVLIYDTNGIIRHPVRMDIDIYTLNATEECARRGNTRLFNTMMLGGYLKVRPGITMENTFLGLKKSLPERAWRSLPDNEAAIVAGMELIRKRNP
ncbi:MAG: 2-oxoacid:acceptor oxidoreductase family protein [Alistipes sp.]|nr:2-oxoacid:acceptor oxidoreductase family protein [Alistipes sp.]